MTQLAQTLIFGALVGGVYALMATGLTLTFGVMKIVNMAQGAFLVLSAYLCYSLWSHFASTRSSAPSSSPRRWASSAWCSTSSSSSASSGSITG